MRVPSQDVSFQTPIPGDAAQQRQLAEAIREALSALAGPWTARVIANPARPGSVIVTVARDDGFECSVFVQGDVQRTFLYIRDQVVNALQLHVLGIPRPPFAVPRLPN